MGNHRLRIVSRKSPLAMWQAEHVRDALLRAHDGLHVEIIGISTEADRFLNKSLASMGGKGAFVKELEQSLLSGRADLAVHSMKDVTVDLPEALSLPVILPREDARDAFVSSRYGSLEELPPGAVLGTSSLRRRCQLKALRPDVEVHDIRGNVGTRLSKLDEGEYDALVLAAAGLKRLRLDGRITCLLEAETILPAIGQGALGIEIRAQDTDVLSLIRPLHDSATFACVSAERALNKRLDTGCLAPVAAHATLADGCISLVGLVGRLDGSELINGCISGPEQQAGELGDALGRDLLARGADAILRELAHAGT